MSARAEQRSSVAEAKANKAGQPSPARAAPERVCLGRIGAARGLKGEVRIRVFTQRARDIAAYGPLTDASGLRSFDLTVVAETAAGGVIARIAGIADRTAAERIRGLELFVARRALPEPPAGEFYQSDLLGLAAEDTEGQPLGRIARIHDFGAGAILEIEAAGKETESGKVRSERGLASRGTRTTLWPAGAIALVDLRAGKLVLARSEEFIVRPPTGGTVAAPEPPGRESAKHFKPGGRVRARSSVLAACAAGRKSGKAGGAGS
ncbi:MAG: ribosome maturation factor RimM [Pseudomonadota bacterium]